jgi:hypothetical protein
MASDAQFNKKSFTTGHTDLHPFPPGRPGATCRAVRRVRFAIGPLCHAHAGRGVLHHRAFGAAGGIERGPAGNTSLAAAISLAQELPQDAVVVVQETEYTGAGKHGAAQLSFARQNGVKVSLGDPRDEVPGESIVLPAHPSLLCAVDADLDHMRRSLITHAASTVDHAPTDGDVAFLAADTKTSEAFVRDALKQ